MLTQCDWRGAKHDLEISGGGGGEVVRSQNLKIFEFKIKNRRSRRKKNRKKSVHTLSPTFQVGQAGRPVELLGRVRVDAPST